MTTDSENEYSKFVPNKLNYEIVAVAIDKNHYQCRLPTPDPSTVRRGIFHQIIATCAVLLLAAACGLPIGYSAVILPQVMSPNSTDEIQLDIEKASWIVSIHSLATPLGSIISGPLADHFGRRTTLLLSVVPTVIGWCILALSESFTTIIIGRILCGFSTGLLGGPGQVYIAETTEPNLRGLLIGAPFFSYSIGIFIVYVLGSAFHWRTVAWCGNVLPILSAVALFYIPETPTWLLRNNKIEKALEALTFLRGNEIIAQKELNDMEERFEKEKSVTKTNQNILQLCVSRVALKPLVIISILSFLQMWSGTFLVVFYIADIISEFGSHSNMHTAAIWTSVVRTICSMIFCFILLYIRRRPIITISGIGSGISCLVLSTFLYLRQYGYTTNYDILIVGTFMLLYIAFNTPLMVMPGIMIGELFPEKIRGRTAGAVFACTNISLFGVAKIFPYINAMVKMRGVFLIFAIASFLVSLFMYMFQPETKGRSLAQIEDYFNEKNWLWYKRDKTYKQVRTNGENELKA